MRAHEESCADENPDIGIVLARVLPAKSVAIRSRTAGSGIGALLWTHLVRVGGDRTGQWAKWYRTAIPEAERLYEDYLEELEALGLHNDTNEQGDRPWDIASSLTSSA